MKRLIAVMLSALMLMAACAFSENNQEQNALLRLEAEDGVLSGDLAVRYSGGTGWVEGFTSQDDELGWTINVPEGGIHIPYTGRAHALHRHELGLDKS